MIICRIPCYTSIPFIAIHLIAGTVFAEKPVKQGDPGCVEVRITSVIVSQTAKLCGTVEVVETRDDVVNGKKTKKVIQRLKLLVIPESRPFLVERGGYNGAASGTENKVELTSVRTGNKTGHIVEAAVFKAKLGTALEIRANLTQLADDGKQSRLLPLDAKKLILIAGHIRKDSRTRGELDFWDERYSQAIHLESASKGLRVYFGLNVYVQNDYRERVHPEK